MQKRLLFPVIWILFVFSCKSSINPNELYGKWQYVKIGHPDADPPATDSIEAKQNSASIEFYKNNSYVINWGGKVLSHGDFKTDGMNIRINELLPDGSKRQFPFWVMKITDKELVFETTGQDRSRVTAIKQQ